MKDILFYEKLPILKNNFSVRLMNYNDLSYLVPHWHEHIELIYFLSGECNFTCNGETFHAKANDFVIVNSTEIHTFTATSPPCYFCIQLYSDFFHDINFTQKTILKNIIHYDKFIQETIKEMYKEYARNDIGSDMLIKSIAYQLMAYLLRNYAVTNLSNKESLLHATKQDRINKILDYISTHYQEKITTTTLANLCFISEGHLCRFFRNNFGKSFTKYINEFRIEKAAIMLTNTTESIANVAVSVGFEDINYFSRIFKKIKNSTPQEYRKNYQFLL